jgi:hypothetical protein
MSYWKDQDWIERVLVPTCRDRNFLKRMSGILSPEDFKPSKGEGMIEAYWIAEQAFKYWRDYHEPIGGMLMPEMKDYLREHKRKIGNKSKEKLLELVDSIRHAEPPVALEAIEKKVIDYKRRREKSRAIRNLIDLQEKGDLDDKKFYVICKKAIERQDEILRVSNYDEEIDKRIARREKNRDREFPLLFIEGFDKDFRTFPRGELGIGLAKYNVGKSTFAVHLGKAYAFQGYNVLHFTLEDIADMVEDRYDSAISSVPMRRLYDKSRKVRRRIKRALEHVRGKIKIVDGTDGGMTVQRIEEVWENYRNQGFAADVVIIDADEGLVAPEHYKGDSGETREMKDIYIELKKLVGKRQVWGWVMAQTKRGKSGQRKMIVTGDDSATDISKLRRCAMCIGIGDGPEDWGDDGRFLFVAKHRYDTARKGFPIAGDYHSAVFYDKETTDEKLVEYNKEKE